MTHFRRRFVVALLGIGLAIALSQIASAQRGRGGRRGFFGVNRVQLATLEKVQTALKMTDGQKELASEVSSKLNEDRRGLFQGGGGGDFAAIREKMEKMNAEASEKVTAKLDDGQRKRLTEIYVQLNGANSLTDQEVAKTLKVTGAQQKGLRDASAENRRASVAAFRDFQNMSDEERAEASAKLRKENDKRLMDVLTRAQQEQFGKLGGEAIDIDTSQLRGRGGRRGGGGRPARAE